jgi:acetyl-CoA acetyltransferase
VHRFAAVSDLERAAVITLMDVQARKHAEQMKRRRQQLEAWEIKQINRAERAKREGVRV